LKSVRQGGHEQHLIRALELHGEFEGFPAFAGIQLEMLGCDGLQAFASTHRLDMSFDDRFGSVADPGSGWWQSIRGAAFFSGIAAHPQEHENRPFHVHIQMDILESGHSRGYVSKPVKPVAGSDRIHLRWRPICS
jgi:hypothetical protein